MSVGETALASIDRTLAFLRVLQTDRNAVHTNMLHGGLAIPSIEQMFHIWGIDDKALLEAVKAEAKIPPSLAP